MGKTILRLGQASIADDVGRGESYDPSSHQRCVVCSAYISDDKNSHAIYCTDKCNDKAYRMRKRMRFNENGIRPRLQGGRKAEAMNYPVLRVTFPQ